MDPVECFIVVPSDRAAVFLRRYQRFDEDRESCPEGNYHDAMVAIGECSTRIDDEGIFRHDDEPDVPHDDHRWPTHCACGHEFAEEDNWQVFVSVLYADGKGGEWRIRDLPPGAMWDAKWMPDWARVNGDGPAWVIKLPNGHDWMPGSRANNCGRKDEPLGSHDCWCVHGEAPKLTVDKEPESGRSTCNAGAGSVGSGKGEGYWHGFLRDGKLVE